jgi:hypothetical protein
MIGGAPVVGPLFNFGILHDPTNDQQMLKRLRERRVVCFAVIRLSVDRRVTECSAKKRDPFWRGLRPVSISS